MNRDPRKQTLKGGIWNLLLTGLCLCMNNLKCQRKMKHSETMVLVAWGKLSPRGKILGDQLSAETGGDDCKDSQVCWRLRTSLESYRKKIKSSVFLAPSSILGRQTQTFTDGPERISYLP